jgi:multidrug efflux pump subunit AcrA (membrane-fusion protein)
MSIPFAQDTDLVAPPQAARRASIESWLARHCHVVPETLHGVVILRGRRQVASYPDTRVTPHWVAEVAERAMAQREPVVISRHSDDGRQIDVIAHPLFQGELLVAAVVLLRGGSTPGLEDALFALQASAREFPVLIAAQQAADGEGGGSSRAILSLFAETAAAQRSEDGIATLALGLASMLRCDKVSIGFRSGEAARLVGSSDANWRSEAVSQEVRAAAIDEAIDQAATLVYPPPGRRARHVLASHSHLSQAQSPRALCTVPLVWREQVVGAMLAERPLAQPFTGEDVRLLERAATVAGPWLAMVQRVELPAWRLALRALARSAEKHWGQGRYRLAGAALGLLAAAVLLWPVQREVSAPVKIEGAMQRALSAPHDGYLQKVLVRPGDIVKSGQVLLEFGTEDVEVERRRLVAELGSHEVAVSDAMAKQDQAAFATSSAKADESRAMLELLEHRLQRAKVTAPFDGVVLQGDLSHALGTPSRKGDLLIVMAPVADFRAVMEVDEQDVALVRAGKSGRMVLTALPQREYAVRARQVSPLAATAPGRTFFEVRLDLSDGAQATADLRPGMRGMARLYGDQAPRGRVWFEQLTGWCRVLWWRWTG